MSLKRYSHEELLEICTNKVYEYIAEGNTLYLGDRPVEGFSGKSIPRLLMNKRLVRIKDLIDRLGEICDLMHQAKNDTENKMIEDTIRLIINEIWEEEDSCIKVQKVLYTKYGAHVHASRTCFEVPLNKHLNAFYDDLNINVAMYDDLSTLACNSIYTENLKGESTQKIKDIVEIINKDKRLAKELKKLVEETFKVNNIPHSNCRVDEWEKMNREERIAYAKENMLITHMTLVRADSLLSNSNINIFLVGEAEEPYCTLGDSSQTNLTKEFADFNKVTLAMTQKIKNNDLQQYIQTKIDMDKENLKVLAEYEVGEDLYKILATPEEDMLYIRYTCPSTGRVYYNRLNEENLKLSKYFKDEDYKSYILAWWNITHLDGNPLSERKPIRC